VEQELDEMFEEHGGEEGLLNDVVDGEATSGRLLQGGKARLKPLERSEYDDERSVLKQYAPCSTGKRKEIEAQVARRIWTQARREIPEAYRG